MRKKTKLQTNNSNVCIIKLDECKYIGGNSNSSTYLMKNKDVVKVYTDPYNCKKDFELLTSLQLIDVVPKIYNFCGHYIIREYIIGISLNKYIKQNGLNHVLSLKLITFMDKIYNSNVRNLNINLNNIFIKNDDALILVDVEYCLNKKNIFQKLFEDLKNLSLLNIFLEDIKNYNLDLYNKIQ
jgi:RIO-like serine/threonine protein kinase